MVGQDWSYQIHEHATTGTSDLQFWLRQILVLNGRAWSSWPACHLAKHIAVSIHILSLTYFDLRFPQYSNLHTTKEDFFSSFFSLFFFRDIQLWMNEQLKQTGMLLSIKTWSQDYSKQQHEKTTRQTSTDGLLSKKIWFKHVQVNQ